MDTSICPIPHIHKEKIVIGHGSGGRLSRDLIQAIFLPRFSNIILDASNDAGVFNLDQNDLYNLPDKTRLAMSTDSHVVWPLTFPGGDIGRLSICGSVNDVAMMGAEPLYITVGFILEEGLEISLLEKITTSMQEAALEARVQIVAGDTKVVQRGKADGIYINTTGLGYIKPGINIHGANAQPGDAVILSGSIGEHGMAVLFARGELGLELDIMSDVAPLNNLVKSMLSIDKRIHVLRDPTRGGLATTLNEIAIQSQVGIVIEEKKIPIRPAVASACELLGFDPFYVANEGKLIAVVSRDNADRIVDIMRQTPYGSDATIIGEIIQEPKKRVLMKTQFGTTRILDMLSGELLPRIC